MFMVIIESIISLVFFLVELAALFAYGYWGFHIDRGWILRIVLGIGTPMMVAVIWGMFVAPKARDSVSIPVKALIQFAVFTVAAFALYGSGQKNIAIFFEVVSLIEMGLVYMMKL
jgi:hypothetical protein